MGVRVRVRVRARARARVRARVRVRVRVGLLALQGAVYLHSSLCSYTKRWLYLLWL